LSSSAGGPEPPTSAT